MRAVQGGVRMRKLAMLLCVTSASLSAQWPVHPTPGLPRTPDGKPNLAAPAPRASGGKPDLSGVWAVKNYGGSLFYVTGDMKLDDMLPWAAELYKQSAANYRRDSDGVHCLPPGPKAGFAVGPFPMKIIQTPDLIAVLYEYQTVFRQFFMDGRGLPEDANPTWMGYSVARWEGDTLVVTTAGYNDKTNLDLAGHPHTEGLKLTERYHRRDIGHMDLALTYEDPKAYKRAWTLAVEFELVPDQELIEYICENERDAAHLVGTAGEEAKIAAEVLAKYVGHYDTPGFTSADLTLEDGRLMIDTGTGKIPLVAHSETNFTMEGTGVDFVKDAKGAVTNMIERWTEGDRNYVRKK
jgi:hypothetical protein